MLLDFCAACGTKDNLNHHHLMPALHGATSDETNLITLCRKCHGLWHGCEWSNNHTDLIRKGQARAKAMGIKLGGRTIAERDPAVVAAAIELDKERPRLSYEAIGKRLAEQGYFNRNGKPYASPSVIKMLKGVRPAIGMGKWPSKQWPSEAS